MEFEDFEKQVSDQELKGMVILQIALISGPLFFAIMTILLGVVSTPENSGGDPNIINILSALTGFFMFNGVIVYNIASKVSYNQNFVKSMFESENPVKIFLAKFRGTRILQMAFLEGAALMGVVCYLLGTLNNIINSNLYLLNFLPVLVLMAIGLSTLPNRRYLYSKYKNLENLHELMGS